MSEWISVKERLPEVGESVIGFCNDHNPRVVFLSRNWFRGVGWLDGNTWRALPIDRVTHWMPLPEDDPE